MNVNTTKTKPEFSIVAKSFTDARRVAAINQSANITRTLASHKAEFTAVYYAVGVVFVINDRAPETLTRHLVESDYLQITQRDDETEILLTW